MGDDLAVAMLCIRFDKLDDVGIDVATFAEIGSDFIKNVPCTVAGLTGTTSNIGAEVNVNGSALEFIL